MKHLNEMQKELSRAIKNLKRASTQDIAFAQNYVGRGSTLRYLGLSLPQTRSVLGTDLKVHRASLREQFIVFQKNWFGASTHDQKSLSIFWLENLSEEDLLIYGKKILAWAPVIDNWALSDGLCNVFSKIFELDANLALPIYKKWNAHKNPWLRRCSMVGLFYYSRSRKVQPSFKLAASMVSPHFGADEYYVQKAVGWTIREMYNVYPHETIQFIDNNLHRITSIAWVAASEKLKLDIKAKFLKTRRISRTKT